MEDKYYTPELSDIFIGQEIWVRGFTKIESYILILYDLVDFCKMNSPLYKGIPCQIKYLDEEDIESLGFIYDYDDSTSEVEKYYYHTDEEIDLYINFNSKEVIIVNRTKTKMIFNGLIKSKSELKKLMKMLGIR